MGMDGKKIMPKAKVKSWANYKLSSTKIKVKLMQDKGTKTRFTFLDWINFLLGQKYCSFCSEYVKITKHGHHGQLM